MKAIRVHQYGGVEALTLEDVPVPEPGRGDVRVRIEAAGVNYIDVYHREGLYKSQLPFTPGMEAAGQVDATGQDVGGLHAGDQVAYAMSQGSYAQYAIVPASKLVKIPAGIDSRLAAAAMLQGMTAHYLTRSTYALQPGEIALIHAAAGGTGRLMVQMAKMRGARVIGTVSTEEKAAVAREAGADEVILYTETDFEAEVKRLTDGVGVHVAYDSVGLTTFQKSLNCLKPRGYLVSFGQSSGSVPPFDPIQLSARGSLFLTRPSLAHYTSSQEELQQRARDVFRLIADGKLTLRIEEEIPLPDAARAHSLLEERRTSGKLLLIP